MPENIIDDLRQTLHESINAKILQSSDHFFKQGEQAKVYGVRMYDVGKIAKEFYKKVSVLPKAEIFALCGTLWQSGYLEEAVIACECAYSLKAQYEPEDFEVFEYWLSTHVDNWASCDTLCNHSIGTLIEQYPQYLSRLKAWTASENRWVRRGAAVTLIIPAKKGLFFQDILDIALAGTSATLLAKRWESALLVNVDNDTLKRLLASPEAMKALMNIEGFRNLNSDLTTIINKSEAVKKAKKENPDPTPKEKKELSAEEKEMKSKRKQIQEKLIKFATRIPVFMYLTDYRERCLKDVITQLEPGLFKKVTGLSVEDFNMLCSLGVFNAPLMNDAIFKFKRYEDASLTYTGIDKHTNDEVGGWDTTIRRTQYEKLFYNQQSSMSEVDYSAYSRNSEVVEEKRAEQQRTAVKVERPQPKPVVQPQPTRSAVPASPKSSAAPNNAEFDLKTQLESLAMDSTVLHKKFGRGTVVKINKNEKFIHIKFTLGEKKFIFPDALLMGFLEVE